MRGFRSLFLSISVLCLAGTSANAEEALTVFEKLSIEGLSLQSSLPEVESVIQQLRGEGMVCHERFNEPIEATHGPMTKIIPLDYNWTCSLSESSQRHTFQVRYIHNHVVGIIYNGGTVPDLGGVGIVEFVQSANDSFQSIADPAKQYIFEDYAEIRGASSPTFRQDIKARYVQKCNAWNGNVADYPLEFLARYTFSPKADRKTINIGILRDNRNVCFPAYQKPTNPIAVTPNSRKTRAVLQRNPRLNNRQIR